MSRCLFFANECHSTTPNLYVDSYSMVVGIILPNLYTDGYLIRIGGHYYSEFVKRQLETVGIISPNVSIMSVT